MSRSGEKRIQAQRPELTPFQVEELAAEQQWQTAKDVVVTKVLTLTEEQWRYLQVAVRRTVEHDSWMESAEVQDKFLKEFELAPLCSVCGIVQVDQRHAYAKKEFVAHIHETTAPFKRINAPNIE